MDRYTVRMIFEDEILQIGSVLDGQKVDELVGFDGSQGEANTFYLTCIPRVGEIIELPSEGGFPVFTFKVLAVHYRVMPGEDDSVCQVVRLLLKQITLNDRKWY